MSLINNVRTNEVPLKHFFRFLKDKGVFRLFFKRLYEDKNPLNNFNGIYKHDVIYFFNSCEPRLWTTECFCWADQKEGRDFWERIHIQWGSYFYNFVNK